MKPSERAVNQALIRKLGRIALDSLTGEHFINTVQELYINKDVAAHFIIMFAHDDKGKRLTNVRASNLFRVYCKLLYRYAHTKPQF